MGEGCDGIPMGGKGAKGIVGIRRKDNKWYETKTVCGEVNA